MRAWSFRRPLGQFQERYQDALIAFTCLHIVGSVVATVSFTLSLPCLSLLSILHSRSFLVNWKIDEERFLQSAALPRNFMLNLPYLYLDAMSL